MITELKFQNHLAFVCDISHYDELMDISRTQPNIHGVAKTEGWYHNFSIKLKTLLLNSNDQLFVSALRNTSTGQLISYMITSIPYDQSCFMFFKFGETRKTNTFFSDNRGIYGLWKLSMSNGLEHNVFDSFMAITLPSYRPLINLIKNCSYIDNDGIMYTWQINSVVAPDQQAKNTIQKMLVPDNSNMLERTLPLVICHASLKPEFRVRQFANIFGSKTELVEKESIQG